MTPFSRKSVVPYAELNGHLNVMMKDLTRCCCDPVLLTGIEILDASQRTENPGSVELSVEAA